MQNLSYENEFCMQFHFHANQNHFHKNGFALRLGLKQRHEGTRNWPIPVWESCCVDQFTFHVQDDYIIETDLS